MHFSSTDASKPSSPRRQSLAVRTLILSLVAALVSTLVAPAVSAAPKNRGNDAGAGVGRPSSAQPVEATPTKGQPNTGEAGKNPLVQTTEGKRAPGRGSTVGQVPDTSGVATFADTGDPVHRPYTAGVADNGMAASIRVKVSQGIGRSLNVGRNALTSLRVAWGDGTSSVIPLTDRTVLTSTVFRLDHVYPYAGEQTQHRYNPRISLADVAGNVALDDSTVIVLAPTFDLQFGALQFKPLTKCDSFGGFEGHGDFRAMWLRPDGQHASDELKAKKGRTRWITAFEGDYRGLEAHQVNRALIKPDLVEIDSFFTKLFFWEWDFGSTGTVDARDNRLPEVGVHEVLDVQDGGGEAPGVANVGDDECVISFSYRYTVTPVTRLPRF